MAQIRMTPDTMRTRARETNQSKRKAEEVKGEMDRLLRTLQAEWEGEAVKGYADRYAKIAPVLKNTIDLLDEISKNLTSTAKIVEETDREIAAQYRK